MNTILKILVIDDNPDTLDLVSFQLKEFEVVTASSGGEALEILEYEDIDAVILDLAMPVLDGLEVAEQIRLNEALHPERKTKIAFYTAHIVDDAILRIAEKTQVERIFKKAETDLRNEVREWLIPPFG
jgi:CheY-like chemotaxis protein